MLPRTALLASRLRPQSVAQRPRQQVRGYAAGGRPDGATTSPIPIFAAGAGILGLFGFYFVNSSKDPGSGQAFKKEQRRQGSDPSQERRDLRDSPVKSLEDKKKKEAGEPLGKTT